MPFIFMGIMSWGSYDPRDGGFWGAIMLSVFVGMFGDYFLVKLKENSNDSPQV